MRMFPYNIVARGARRDPFENDLNADARAAYDRLAAKNRGIGRNSVENEVTPERFVASLRLAVRPNVMTSPE